MKFSTLHKWSYIIMAVLTLIMIIAVIAVSASGNIDVLKGPLVFVIFGIYFVMQLGCIIFMKPSLSVYKIGFYLLHIGMLVMLVGFMLYEMFGQSLYANVPVNSSGAAYTQIQKQNQSFEDLGFGIRLNNFVIEKYETGAPKQYNAYLGVYEPNESKPGSMYNSDNVTIKVNETYRKNGWKIYLMSYDDGSIALPERELFEEYSSAGGAGAVVAQMTNSGKYGDATVNYFVYNIATGAYTSIGSDVSSLANFTGHCTARVYQGDSGDFYVYMSNTYVHLLFKEDPGEYVVLTGMAMIILGVLLMCIIRGKKASASEKTEQKAPVKAAEQVKKGSVKK